MCVSKYRSFKHIPRPVVFRTSNKSEKDINSEIKAIIRQITASVSFLPDMSQNRHTFEMLIYTDKDAAVPQTWQLSDAKKVKNGNSEVMPLRQFSTNIHTVNTPRIFVLARSLLQVLR